MKRVCSFLLGLAVASPAFAGDEGGSAAAPTGLTATDPELGVTATAPDGWEVERQNDERASFAFRNEDHSQIEVIGNDLLTADVSAAFFRQFHELLQGSSFSSVGQEDKTIGDLAGTETIYRFDHTNATLKVAVFQFVRDTKAWLVVLYAQDDAFDSHVDEFRATIAGLTFQ